LSLSADHHTAASPLKNVTAHDTFWVSDMLAKSPAKMQESIQEEIDRRVLSLDCPLIGPEKVPGSGNFGLKED
jgi:hypothetical protein